VEKNWGLIFLTVLSLTVALMALSYDGVIFFDTSITDWIIAVSSIGGVLVAIVAAGYLRDTLSAAQQSNNLIALQLRSNNPVVLCDGFTDFECFKIETTRTEYDVACEVIWRNLGKQPALNVRFKSVGKASSKEAIDYQTVAESLRDAEGDVIPESQLLHQELHIRFVISEDPETYQEIRNPYFSVLAVYKDGHGSARIVEHGFMAYWAQPEGPTGQRFLRLRQSGPDNEDTLLTD